MQNFININRVDPEKMDAVQRLRNFEEIYRLFDNEEVRKQAERCVQCGNPFCTTIGCPLQNHIPQWLEAIANRDLDRAFKLSNESSPFPEILGRVCPQSHLCEGACTLEDGHGAISIGAIEASITDLAFAAGMKLPFPGVRHPHKVAVIGSGPAGFSCAHFLLRAGIAVEMYERAEKPGGLLTYGIPGFKLDKKIVAKRFELLEEAGLKLHLNQNIGEDVALDGLIENHDAVFLGLGATQGRSAGLKGSENEGVVLAMEYLTAKQKNLFGHGLDPLYDVTGKRVVVLGGGDTAMDCLRTAMRSGASEVTCLYRRDEANMPGSAKELHNAMEEGVEFSFNTSPLGIERNESGLSVQVEKTRMGEKAADGRQRVEAIPDSAYQVEADLVILALGFDVAPFLQLEKIGIDTDRWGQIGVSDLTGLTSHDKVYAGGDCNRGADLVVTAAADGRRAALQIMHKLLRK